MEAGIQENKYGQVIQKVCVGQLYRKRDHNGMERNDLSKGENQIQNISKLSRDVRNSICSHKGNDGTYQHGSQGYIC